jgi:molybdopterin converting factor small subunit
MSRVRIPPTLRAETGGRVEVEADGASVRDLLDDLTARFPALRGRLEHANVYVDRQDIRTLDGLDTEVAENSEVILLPAMAGGV